MKHREFIRVQVTHAYRGGACPDVAFVIPSDTARTLARGRMLVRRHPGALSLLLECTDAGVPRVELDALLRIGVRVSNPHFENFTDLPWAAQQQLRVFRSAVAPDTLAPPTEATLVGLTPAFVLARTTRPVMIAVRDANNEDVWTETRGDGDDRSEVSCDFRSLAPGRYTLVQADVDETSNTNLYIDAELRAQGCIAAVELGLTPAVYARTNTWTLAFEARSEPLRYWVVAKGLSNSEIDNLAVSDEGWTEDGRTRLMFDKLSAADFDSADAATAARIAGGEDVLLFQSTTNVARSQTPLRKLQLGRNGDVVVPNLPLPGPERATAEMIIHLTKP